MTKYIDLLREHQQEDKTEKDSKPKKKKKGKKSAAKIENPYSHNQEKDDAMLEDMEALIEEPESNIQDTPNLNDYDVAPELEDLLTDEKDTGTLEHHKELKTASTMQAQGSVNTFGFDVSSWLEHVNQTLITMFSSVQADEKINIDILGEHLSTLFDQLQTSPHILEVLELEIHPFLKENINSHHHADLAHKAMLMMLYSLKVGLQLKLSLKELLANTAAAMLHHLGLAFTPADTRKNNQKLSKSARKQALEYLEKHHIQHDHLHLAITQLSESYNGSGPEGLTAHDISWTARLVTLLSTYETMTAYTNTNRFLPRDAIREIVKERKREFDPEILKALIESVSLYPVGMYVQLNTGEVGQVISTHAQSPLRPVVFITMDKNGDPVTERKIDLKKQTNIMVTRSFFKEDIQSIREKE